jgi:putative hydrolase of the HAD superfamily
MRSDITALFWDVGGVLLTNGWDESSRRKAAETFELDWDDFERRHQRMVAAFEINRVTFEEYLDETVFYRNRAFTKEAFRSFVLDCSKPQPETLDIATGLADCGRYFMATLNNESLELNQFRIGRFQLRRCFSVFFSSCFLGTRKPAAAIYQTALKLTQRSPAECLFIDDRIPNVEAARRLGIESIHYRSPQQLRAALASLAIQP